MSNYYDTGKKLKAFIIVTVILLLINGFISYLSYKNKASFYTNEGKFSLVSKDEEEIVFKDMDKNLLKVIIEDKTPNEISFATLYKVYYKDRMIESDSSKYETDGLIITQSDSSKYVEKFTDNQYSKVYRSNASLESLSNDVQIIYNIERINDIIEENKSLKTFIWIAGATILGSSFMILAGSIFGSEILMGATALIGLVIVLGSFFYNIIYAFMF